MSVSKAVDSRDIKKLKLKASLSKCGRTSVENEAEYIRQNVLGNFVDEEE